MRRIHALSLSGIFERAAAVVRIATERMGESAVRWRTLGALYVLGGLLGMGSALLPHAHQPHLAAVLVLAGLTTAAGLATLLAAERLPAGDGAIAASLVAATVLVTIAVVLDDSSASPFELLYLWVGFDAFFFLRGRLALGVLALFVVALTLALAVTPSGGDAVEARWLMTVGAVTAVSVMAHLLRARSDRLIAQLSEAALTDPLTGLLNRRGFGELIADELERARRTDLPVSLVIGDLDHFKLVNDRYGHERGDQALRDFADLARSSARRIDGIARLGGEEFAIVLPGTDARGAVVHAERLRRATRERLASYGSDGLSITFGVASWPEHGGERWEDLMRAADEALYVAKRRGRNRTVVHDGARTAEEAGGHAAAPAAVEHIPAVLVLAETFELRHELSTRPAHGRVVGRFAEVIATEMGLSGSRVERVRLAGVLHDIGKIGLPAEILRKPGPLSDDEWAEMRRHPELGARILEGANLADVAAWVLAHHERPDGRGYPLGAAAEAIPLEARILAVAEAYEAMTTDSVYRQGMPEDEAVRELRRGAGTQFDAEVVEAFLEFRQRAGSAGLPF